MYKGVLRDDERRREKMKQREEDLIESQRKRELYERAQNVERSSPTWPSEWFSGGIVSISRYFHGNAIRRLTKQYGIADLCRTVARHFWTLSRFTHRPCSIGNVSSVYPPVLAECEVFQNLTSDFNVAFPFVAVVQGGIGILWHVYRILLSPKYTLITAGTFITSNFLLSAIPSYILNVEILSRKYLLPSFIYSYWDAVMICRTLTVLILNS